MAVSFAVVLATFVTFRLRSSIVWLALLLLLTQGRDSRADIGLVVFEPIKTLGLMTRVGHAGIYLSNICPDGSPVRMRLCHASERGSILSKYSSLGGGTDYDWAIVPLEQFLNGVDSSDLTPLVATQELRAALQAAGFARFFSGAIGRTLDGAVPAGQWQTAMATRFDRTIYILSITTFDADDRTIVEAFNSAPNKSHFNFFYDNCSNQAKALFDLLLSGAGSIGDRKTGLTMETPKGLAKTLVDRALEDPRLQLRIERYPQLPGTIDRSREVLFPMENTYRNVTFAPYWFFGGYRAVAFGAMLYHEVLAPFSLAGAFEDFLSPRASEFTVLHARLSRLQDGIRLALQSAGPAGDRSRFEWEERNASVFRRLRAVKAEKAAEVRRILGSKERWQAYDRQFQSMVQDAGRNAWFSDELRALFSDFKPNGQLSDRLLAYFEAEGHFYVDEQARGPWMRLDVGDEEPVATGLGLSQVLAGDHQLGFLVLAAAIDYNLYTSEDRREDLDFMERALTLLREAQRRFQAVPIAGRSWSSRSR